MIGVRFREREERKKRQTQESPPPVQPETSGTTLMRGVLGEKNRRKSEEVRRIPTKGERGDKEERKDGLGWDKN